MYMNIFFVFKPACYRFSHIFCNSFNRIFSKASYFGGIKETSSCITERRIPRPWAVSSAFVKLLIKKYQLMPANMLSMEKGQDKTLVNDQLWKKNP